MVTASAVTLLIFAATMCCRAIVMDQPVPNRFIDLVLGVWLATCGFSLLGVFA